MQKTIENIAKNTLKIDTLAVRGRDCLDFHDVYVGKIEEALKAAYIAGQSNSKNCRKYNYLRHIK